jgi:hypothetical protein
VSKAAGGLIAGIVIGVILCITIPIVLCFCCGFSAAAAGGNRAKYNQQANAMTMPAPTQTYEQNNPTFSAMDSVA